MVSPQSNRIVIKAAVVTHLTMMGFFEACVRFLDFALGKWLNAVNFKESPSMNFKDSSAECNVHYRGPGQ